MELKNLLNKKTIVSTSIGTLMAMSGGVWMVAGEFNEALAQIADNAQAVESLELRSIDVQLSMLHKERREIRRTLRESPDDTFLLEDMEEVEDEIVALGLVRACLIDVTREVCQ